MATPRSTSYLNALWITGYIPTQSDFEDLFVSFANLQDNNYLDLNDTAITAQAGGGQGSAYPITKLANQLTTVATAGDSVVLPVATVGKWGYIFNTQTAAADVFPAVGDYFVNLNPNIANSLPGGYIIFFRCLFAGQWIIQYISDTGISVGIGNAGITATTLTPIMSLSNTYHLTALATGLTINAPTWKFGGGQLLTIAIKDDGTVRSLAWNGIYEGLNVVLPSQTYQGAQMYFTFMYNSTTNKWQLINYVVNGSYEVPRYIYIGKISQTGTGAPTIAIIRNNLQITPTWARSSTGIYTLTATGFFDSAKTAVSIMGTDNSAQLATASVTSSPNVVTVETIDTIGVHHDGYLSSRPFKIEIYQ